MADNHSPFNQEALENGSVSVVASFNCHGDLKPSFAPFSSTPSLVCHQEADLYVLNTKTMEEALLIFTRPATINLEGRIHIQQVQETEVMKPQESDFNEDGDNDEDGVEEEEELEETLFISHGTLNSSYYQCPLLDKQETSMSHSFSA